MFSAQFGGLWRISSLVGLMEYALAHGEDLGEFSTRCRIWLNFKFRCGEISATLYHIVSYSHQLVSPSSLLLFTPHHSTTFMVIEPERLQFASSLSEINNDFGSIFCFVYL